jgi:hypothetical protein
MLRAIGVNVNLGRLAFTDSRLGDVEVPELTVRVATTLASLFGRGAMSDFWVRSLPTANAYRGKSICASRLMKIPRARQDAHIARMADPLGRVFVDGRGDEATKASRTGSGPRARSPAPIASSGLVVIVIVIVAIPIAAVREYRIRIFGRIVLDALHARPVSGIGGIACTFVRGDFREHT